MTDTTPPGTSGTSGGSAGDPPVCPDKRVLAMVRTFDRTGRKVDALDRHVTQLAADLTRLVGVVTAARPPHTPGRPADDHGDDKPGDEKGDEEKGQVGPVKGGRGKAGPAVVRSWLLAADPEQAVTDLADLIEWLDRVYLRYPNTDLSACWLWHPHVIEELWWLRKAHAAAYHRKDGSWLRVGDWHDRQRPAVVRRVRETVAKCDLSLHAPTKPHGQPPAVARWPGTPPRSPPLGRPAVPGPSPPRSRSPQGRRTFRRSTGASDDPPGVQRDRVRAAASRAEALPPPLRAVDAARRPSLRGSPWPPDVGRDGLLVVARPGPGGAGLGDRAALRGVQHGGGAVVLRRH